MTSVVPVCIGVDIGGTNIRTALVASDGAILSRSRLKTEINHGLEPFLDRLTAVLGEMVCEAVTYSGRVIGVGLGIPGLISNDGDIYSSVNLQPLQGINLARLMGARTGLPVLAVNDANASALGEQRFGAGQGFASMLTLTLGTGVGSGLILDNRLWTGIDGVAAEYGHATVEPEGYPCPCGNSGCLEQYASASALVAAAERAIANGCGGDLTGHASAGLTSGIIAELARAGDPAAIALFEQAGRYLGIAIASAVNLLNLEAVIIGGGVGDSFDLLHAPIERELQRRTFAIPGNRVQLLKGALGDDAGILGAVALAWQRFAGGKLTYM